MLLIIDECGRILATPNENKREGEGVSEREYVTGAALLALQMVESSLEKQERFFDIMRQVSHDYHVIIT